MIDDGLIPAQGTETLALVIGGGIAGLLAAHVLSSHYDQVQIVERDSLPEMPEYRAGTPQSFHLHRLLPRGVRIIQALFPGILSELLEHGAASTRHGKLRTVNRFGQFVLHVSAEEATCSRALLEWTIRRRVQDHSNVCFSTGLEVVGLQNEPEQMRITGVHIRPRGQTEKIFTQRADLVVDTSGSSTKLPQWLQASGYDVPEPERLKTALGYSTRYYKVSPQYAKEQLGIIVDGKMGTPDALALLVENELWYVTLFKAGGQYPATDDEGFESDLRRIINLELAETLQAKAEPITSPRGYRVAECLRQHFDQMECWPAGLLAMGDSLCNLDPIYGQGMSVAALEAETLARCLTERRDNPQPHFERRTLASFQEAIEPAWWTSAVADLRWPGVTYTGQKPPKAVKLVQCYLDLYLQEATRCMEEQALQESDSPPVKPDLFAPQPSFLAYSLMNGLTLSPRVIFNATTYRQLLAIEAIQEGPHRLQNLTEQYHRPLEDILDDVLPEFLLTFYSPRTSRTAPAPN